MDVLEYQKWAYIPDLPEDIGPFRQLLLEYSKIPADDVDSHLLRMRENAWKIFRFPCIGRWRFLRLAEPENPLYQQLLFRLKVPQSEDAFLDLGCCVGQMLRQLRRDGVHGSQLFGADLESSFIDIGFDLFQDRQSLGATFVVGDILDSDDKRLDALLGKVTVVCANAFFHLFNWDQQVHIGQRIVGFLKPGTRNALIYGRHVGSDKPGTSPMGGRNSYLHNRDSFQRLWDTIGELTDTKWAVELEHSTENLPKIPDNDKNTRLVDFAVHQVV